MSIIEASMEQAVDSEEARCIEEEEIRLIEETEHIWQAWPREHGRTKLTLVNPKSPRYR